MFLKPLAAIVPTRICHKLFSDILHTYIKIELHLVISYRAVNNIFFEIPFNITFLPPLWLRCRSVLICLPNKKIWTNFVHAFMVYCSSHLLCKEQEGLLIIQFFFWSFLRSQLRPSRCILCSSTALIFYCPQVCEFSNVSLREVKRKLLQPYGTIVALRHNDSSLEARFLIWDILAHTSQPASFSFQAYFVCASNFWNTTRNLPALSFSMEMEFYWICCSAPYHLMFCKRAERYSGATAVLFKSPQGGGELSVIH